MVLTSVLRDVLKHPKVRVSDSFTETVTNEHVNNLFERFETKLSEFILNNDSFESSTGGLFYLLKPNRTIAVRQIQELIKSLKLSKQVVIKVQAYTEVTLLLKFIIAFAAEGYELYGYVPNGMSINLDFRNV
jgi:hypothetical protein